MRPTSFFLVLFALMVCPFTLSAAEDTPKVLDQFRFDGIAYDPKKPDDSIVMINAIALHQGDIYRGFKVEEISMDHIVLTDTETKEAYDLFPGNGQANVQKAANWDPLKKLADLKIKLPDQTPKKPAPANGGSKKPYGELDGSSPIEKLMAQHPLMKSYDETKEKIDQIKADRDKRDAELDKLFERPEQTKVTN